MTRATFVQYLSAASLALGALQAGIVNIPIDDSYKSIVVLGISVVSTFIAGLLHTPSS